MIETESEMFASAIVFSVGNFVQIYAAGIAD